jgi:hypothetical protein
MNQPSFVVYLDRTGEKFAVNKQFANGQGLNLDSGALVWFNREQMESEAVRFAINHFREFGKRVFEEPGEFTFWTEDQRQQFNRDHKMIAVYQPTPTQACFWPFRRGKKGKSVVYVPLLPDECVSLTWPSTAEKFFRALMKAFDEAS